MNYRLPVFKLLMGLLPALALNARPATAQFSGAFEGMSFQGYLTDNADNPINGTKDITIRLFDGSTTGTQYWERTYTGVPITNGVFHLILVEGTPPLAWVAFDKQFYAEIEVDSEIVGSRVKLTSVPYALGLRNLRVIPEVDDEGPSLLGGFLDNTISTGVKGATISGGGAVRESNAGRHQVTGDYGTIGGGFGNTAYENATVSGGTNNEASGSGAVIGGGEGSFSTDYDAVVGGGSFNTASGEESTVAGGYFGTASGNQAAIGGGSANTAAGQASTVPGGTLNYAGGRDSFAAGNHARVRDASDTGGPDGDDGTFVWSDRSNTTTAFESTGRNQFLIEADGGVGINTNAPAGHLHIAKANNNTGGGVVIEANEQDRLYMYFIADDNVTIGTYRGSDGRRLPIALQPNGGNVGIGTTSPSEKLEVNGNVLANNVAVPSDARYKKNIQPIVGPLGLLSKLNGVRYEYDREAHPEKSFDSGVQFGLIAQNVRQVLPELVHENDAGYLSVNY
ncbi:MAG: tail fiber domain-containing protein, partial [Rhodothermales bacterium]